MNRSFLYGLVGLVGVAAMGLVPLACTSGEVGQPCLPEDENSFRFPGFKVTEDIIESRSFQCATRICLVNHFQGRVSCPLGQPAPKDANGQDGCQPVFQNGEFVEAQGSCREGELCVQAGSLSPPCDISKGQEAANEECLAANAGGKCNAAGFCECSQDADCQGLTDAVVSCDAKTKQCVQYACHKPGNCQRELAEGEPKSTNAGKACCVPGTDTPVTTPVCGQCVGTADKGTPRDAESAVYCSCRCGVAEGEEDDPNFNFCTCPDGFACTEIRKNIGLGDEKITGKYCIKIEGGESTEYKPGEDQCVFVDGYWVSGADSGIKCAGAPTNKCLSPDGPCD